MPTVSELDGWGRRLASLLDELVDKGEAEALEALEAAADAYEAATVDKAVAIVAVIQSMDDQEQIARRDRSRADAAIKYWRRQRQRVRALLRELLVGYERTTGSRSIATTHATVGLTRRREYRYPDSIEEWPSNLLTEVVSVRPDRSAARALIDAGEAPEGFGASDITALQVRSRGGR